MNKKILAGLVAVSLSTSVFAADSDTDNHDVTVTVAEVALIDVADAAVAITVTAPTEAGSNFDMSSATGNSTYAITSNIALDQTTTTSRSLTAEVDAIDPAFVLTATVAAPTGGVSPGGVALAVDGTGDGADVVTGIGNVAESGIAIAYALTLDDAAVVPAHGAHTINVAYTLGAEE